MSWNHRLEDRFLSLRSATFGIVGLTRERVESGIAFNPMRSDLRVNPYPFYRELREKSPVHRAYAADGWVLSRYDDVVAVLSDRSFSSDERHMRRYPIITRRRLLAGLPDMYEAGISSMLRLDPPDHTRLRGLVSKAFTPRKIEAMRPRISELIDELLAKHRPGGRLQLVRDFAAPLPVIVIAEMLGVPSSDRERFHHWSDEAIRTLGGQSLEDQRRAWQAMQEMRDYFAEKIVERRHEERGDLLAELVAAEEAGDRLSDQELFTTLVLLLVAGNETTTKLISNAMVALLRNPEQLEILRKEPDRIPGAIEELLRFDSPVQLTSRMVTGDRRFAGVDMKRGDQIVLLLGAANRDPDRFPEPDRLDVQREDTRHLAFSHGLHFCLGAQLARLEASMAIDALLTRYTHLSLEGEVAWGDNPVLRGPLEVPLGV
ncbi:MAG: cytochrome P450 [bacterium]|nr:cytochrome P450 [bacterium]